MRGKDIGLALQGGGSYAAFTSGVLKRLLYSRARFLLPEQIRSISGTSGGAINAVLLGKAIHDNQKNPTDYVSRMWQLNRIENMLKREFPFFKLLPREFLSVLVRIQRKNRESRTLLSAKIPKIPQNSRLKSFTFRAINKMLHYAAPTLPEDLQVGVLPNKRPYVTVAATEVRTAQAHYFTNNTRMIKRFQRFEIAHKHRSMKELTLQGVYASIAHPNLLRPVHIDDDVYWDGYYTSNPPFVHLFREGCDEVILIRLVQREREEVREDRQYIKDRTEEIIQNTTLNMEILAYLAMREIMLSSQASSEGLDLKLGLKKVKPTAVFHEIRLLKSGNIADEGYPLAALVDKLIGMGEKVVSDKNGFIKTYRGAEKGLEVISEINFETEEVASRAVDLDKLLFQEQEDSDQAVTDASDKTG